VSFPYLPCVANETDCYNGIIYRCDGEQWFPAGECGGFRVTLPMVIGLGVLTAVVFASLLAFGRR